jgi:hypothetical protein
MCESLKREDWRQPSQLRGTVLRKTSQHVARKSHPAPTELCLFFAQRNNLSPFNASQHGNPKSTRNLRRCKHPIQYALLLASDRQNSAPAAAALTATGRHFRHDTASHLQRQVTVVNIDITARHFLLHLIIWQLVAQLTVCQPTADLIT